MEQPMMIDIAELGGMELQTRVALDEAAVHDYVEAYREDETRLPPVEVTEVASTGELLLTDGFHRVEAAKRAGRTRIRCSITKGTPTDALAAALKANAAHGLRRTNADKRKALMMAWEHRQELFGGDPSHDALAEVCGLSKSTVRRFRSEAGVSNEHPCERLGTDGKRYSTEKTRAKSSVLLDHVGQEVPERLARTFRSKSALRALNQMAKALRALELVRTEKGNGETAHMEQRLLMDLDTHISTLRRERPYAVCPVCKGEGCRECSRQGFMTRDKYKALMREIEHVGGIENLNTFSTFISTISTKDINTESSNKEVE